MFSRKPKNRRLGREQVLDVKLRSSQVRATRIRILATALAAAVGVVIGVCLVWRAGAWALDRLVYENKSFALQRLDIQTDGVIAVEQLQRWAGVKPGQNLFALDLGRVKRNLELSPLIKCASVERILPRTLRVIVTEREPIAQVNLPRSGPDGAIVQIPFQLDEDGWVMMPLDPRLRSASAPPAGESLTVISGISPSELRPGHRLESPQVEAALHLVTAFERSPMAGLTDLRHIDISSPEILLVTTGQGSEITFALTDLDQQLRRWRAVADEGQKLGKGIASLDLAVSNNTPARWLEASAVISTQPRTSRALHTKKKHV